MSLDPWVSRGSSSWGKPPEVITANVWDNACRAWIIIAARCLEKWSYFDTLGWKGTYDLLWVGERPKVSLPRTSSDKGLLWTSGNILNDLILCCIWRHFTNCVWHFIPGYLLHVFFYRFFVFFFWGNNRWNSIAGHVALQAGRFVS